MPFILSPEDQRKKRQEALEKVCGSSRPLSLMMNQFAPPHTTSALGTWKTCSTYSISTQYNSIC